MEDVVKKQIKAFNSKKILEFLECYSENVKVFMLESGQVLTTGKNQLKEIMSQAFQDNSQAQSKILSLMVQGDLVISLESIERHIPNKRVKTLSIYQIENDLITQLWFGGRTIEDLSETQQQ